MDLNLLFCSPKTVLLNLKSKFNPVKSVTHLEIEIERLNVDASAE